MKLNEAIKTLERNGFLVESEQKLASEMVDELVSYSMNYPSSSIDHPGAEGDEEVYLKEDVDKIFAQYKREIKHYIELIEDLRMEMADIVDKD